MIARSEVMSTFDILDYPNVRWGAIHRSGKIEGGYARTAKELADFAEAYEWWNFYVQPNPSARLGGKRARTEDIVAWRWFIVDLDPIPPVPGTKHVWEVDTGAPVVAVQEALAGFLGHRYEAVFPLVIYSGRGVQLWWRVESMPLDRDHLHYAVPPAPSVADWPAHPMETGIPVLPTTRAIALAQKYWLGRIQERMRPEWGYAVDLSVSDLPRLARCPGTINQKTGRQAVTLATGCGALASHNFLRYVPRAVYVERRGEVRTAPEGMPWQAADPYLTKRASAWLAQGEGEPGRHWGAAAAARSLAEAGVGEDQIVAALVEGGAKCRPPLEDMEYITRTAREAVERVRR